MLNKKFNLILTLVFAMGITTPWGRAQTPLHQESVALGPVSLEPAIEKNGIRVALQTSIQKKDELSVLVKISNLSEQPILVTPDAVQATTEEGFVMKLAGSQKPISSDWTQDPKKKSAWSKFSQVANLIPFSDPYRIISTTTAIAQFAGKSAAAFSESSSPLTRSRRGFLREVILQPGMATHGLIIYDASSLRAFDYAPILHIKVTVGEEPFEFQFASEHQTTQHPKFN